LIWQPLAALPDADRLADANRHAAALLTLLGNLDEPPPPLDDAPQLAAHLHRLDQKLDLLLNLTGQWLKRELALPAPQPLRRGLRGVVWQATLPAGPGRISVYLHGGLPTALELPAQLLPLGDGSVLAEFHGLDSAVTDGLERYIFRCHRRSVAQARRPA
jgi:hypothetical protein